MIDNRNQAENGAPIDDMTGGAHHDQDTITPTKSQASNRNNAFRLSPKQVQRTQGVPGLHVSSLPCPDTSLSFITMGAAGEGCYSSLEKTGKHNLLLRRGWIGSHCSAGWQWTAVNTSALSGVALGTMLRGDPSRRSCAVRTYVHNVCACVHACEHTHTHTRTCLWGKYHCNHTGEAGSLDHKRVSSTASGWEMSYKPKIREETAFVSSLIAWWTQIHSMSGESQDRVSSFLIYRVKGFAWTNPTCALCNFKTLGNSLKTWANPPLSSKNVSSPPISGREEPSMFPTPPREGDWGSFPVTVMPYHFDTSGHCF